MKKLIFTISFIFFITALFAQHNKQVSRKQLELFKKSTTYVVMDPDPMLGYNFAIKSAVEKFWKITPYKFVTFDEFDKLRMNCNNSFIMVSRVSLTKTEDRAVYIYLNFLMGDSVKELNDMPEILELPLCYSGIDQNSYIYKMGVIIRFAQEHVKTLDKSLFLWTYKNLNYYNYAISNIKKKTLLVESSDLADEVNTIEKIKEYYPYDIRIVSSNDIDKAVQNQTPNTLILHVISPSPEDTRGRSYKIIYGVNDNKIYYYDYEEISAKHPAGLLIKDLKRIAG